MNKPIEELVKLARQGHQEAIGALYEQTYNSVFQSVRAIISDEDEALDIVQDSYIKGFRNLDKLGDPQKFQAWMKVIAANLARDHLRKKRPALFSERVDEEGQEIDLRHPDDTPEHLPEEVLDRRETTRLMNDILGTLSDEQRLAIVMYYYEEYSIREIAETLGCSENTVKSRLNYGRKKVEAGVRALEKKGTKLYSLAPLPFLLWLFRMSKGYGIPAETVANSASLSGAAVAGTAAAGSSASASVAAGAAAKAAGGTAAKAVAAKIVAATLAVTVTAGAAVVLTNIPREEPVVTETTAVSENHAAHRVYEDFLSRYRQALAMDQEDFLEDYRKFWEEIGRELLARDPAAHGDHHLDIVEDGHFGGHFPVPDTLYSANMNALTLLTWKLEEEQVCYAYCDIDGDGVDELFVSLFYRGEIQAQNHLTVYAVEDGTLCRGSVDPFGRADGTDVWTIKPGSETDITDAGRVYIHYGKGRFEESLQIPAPDLNWCELMGW